MMLSRLFVLSALFLGTAACASSTTTSGTVDATDDDDGSPADPDATDLDSSTTDGAATDGVPAIDGPDLDAAVGIDARLIDASTCPTAPCDLHQQCGCASPLACDLDFTDLVGTQCRAVNAPGTETSTCASFSECAIGHVCVGGAAGRCEKYCDANSDCGQPRGQCVIQLNNGTTPIAGATTCSANCNPINSAAGGCPSGSKCGFFTVNNALTGNLDRDIVDCTTPGAGALNATCTTDATCGSDLMCSTVNAVTRCRKVCTVGSNECAGVAGATTCGGFNPALVVGGVTYGICR